MDKDIIDALNLLIANGYIINSKTKQMEIDMADCEKSNGDKECLECSCNRCLMQ